MLTDYTTFDSIRAALGVTSDEITDTVLGTEIFLYSLEADLRGIGTGVAAAYAVVAALETRTNAEDLFYKSLRLFAAYSVARHCLDSLPLFSPKAYTDGKAGFTRDSSSPYKEVVIAVNSAYGKFKQQLQGAYSGYQGVPLTVSPVVINFLSVSSPDFDPVVGE